ncbi:MAG TPA: cyclopropane-fatty-acyl-phospholipid synthase family protein [Caulobacteraceae bacterium]|nr:cyclopropane-fatty-acyl-phospholipid synthase family protein [Caulobacteraceae bacterium]
MSFVSLATDLVERAPLPDGLTRAGVAFLVARARRDLDRRPASDADFARAMAGRPIAENTADANAQHYEVPAAFFRQVLGPRLKYSSGVYARADTTLAEAEVAALEETCVHAALADGQSILELGSGWGSLSLWMAERYPASAITAVSNSHSQRAHIEARAAERGLANLTVVTADMNDFQAPALFDRIVSVEMFEHMSNWRALLARAAGWLQPEGRLFLHVFTHRDRPYRFETADRDDWIAKYFFTGGIMPSRGLVRQFPDLFEVEGEWHWSGEHYRRTAMDWLARFDAAADAIDPVLRRTYGRQARLWKRRWRLFFLATAGLFGDSAGAVWGVGHYRLKAARRP